MKRYGLILLSALLLPGCSRAAVTASISEAESETVYEISPETSAYMPIKLGMRYCFKGSDSELDFTIVKGDYGYNITNNYTQKTSSALYTTRNEERFAEYMKVQDGQLYMLFESINRATGEIKTYIYRNDVETRGYATDYVVDLSDETQIHLYKNELYGITSNVSVDSTSEDSVVFYDGDLKPLKGQGKLWYDHENTYWYAAQGLLMLVPDDSTFADQWETVVVPAGTEIQLNPENDYDSEKVSGNCNLGNFWFSCSFTLDGEEMAAVLPVDLESDELCLQDVQASRALSISKYDYSPDMNLWDEDSIFLVDENDDITAGTYSILRLSDYLYPEIRNEVDITTVYSIEFNEHVKYAGISDIFSETLYDGMYALTVGYDDGYEETAFISVNTGTGKASLAQILSYDDYGNAQDPEFSDYENSVFPAGTAIQSGDSEKGTYITYQKSKKVGEKPFIRFELPDGYRTFSELGIGSIETDVYHE